MVIDDDPDILDVVNLVLGRRGYEVVAAQNGAEALRILRRSAFRPDVILLDLAMPIMDGREFRVHQSQDPRLRGIPVVLFSGDGELADAANELQSTEYVQKPVSVEQLVKIAAKYCDRKPGTRFAFHETMEPNISKNQNPKKQKPKTQGAYAGESSDNPAEGRDFDRDEDFDHDDLETKSSEEDETFLNEEKAKFDEEGGAQASHIPS